MLLCMGLCLCFGPARAPGQTDTAPAASPEAATPHHATESEARGPQAEPEDDDPEDPVDIKSGLRVGLNFATFGGEDAETIRTLFRGVPNVTGTDEGRRTGLVLGAFLVADFGGPVDLRPGMRYIQKGNQTVFTLRNAQGEIESGSVTIKADYVEIPILTRVALPAVGPVVPHVLGGPTLGFSVNTAADVSLGGESQSINVGEDFGGSAISLEFGAGANVEVGAGTVTINGRFGFGFSDVPGLRFSAQNRGIMATVGFLF